MAARKNPPEPSENYFNPIRFHVLKEYLEGDVGSQSRPLKEWQLSPELPAAMELMATEPPSLPQCNQADTSSKEEYLETQYRLSRFEGTELLRRALNQFRENPQIIDSEFYIYTQVHVQGYMFAKSGAACRISFSTERSPTKVIWSQSGRLTTGTLVALSPASDNFKTQCFVAVVAARYLKGGLEPDPEAGENGNTPPRIEIFWANHNDAVFDPSIDLVMIEAKGGYYEQVRHAMVGLQHAALYESKFDKYIDGTHMRDEQAAYTKHTQASVPAAAANFDHSQMEAFKRMTSMELAVVQGPPGTGKTFTSVIAIESYIQTLRRGLKNSTPPVIIAAQTNHALDQLLEKCIQIGANVVRLGGRSQVDVINERTMFNLMFNSSKTKGAPTGEANRKKIFQQLSMALETCFPGGLISAEHLRAEGLITPDQFVSLQNNEWETGVSEQDEDSSDLMAGWLADCVEQDRTYVYMPPQGQAEAEGDAYGQKQSPEEDERERLHGDFISTEFYWTGSIPEAMNRNTAWNYQARKYLCKFSDLYNIKPAQRGMVYRYLRQRLIEKFTDEKLPALIKGYQDACDKLKVGRWSRNVQILRDEGVEVLGCTTTGLSKYRGLISELKPLVLMIEEAAETREANIASALYPSLDQVVLVGDHQQLVPHVDVRELEEDPYNLNKSLFERLVDHGIPYTMLKVQRRMIPIIRSVVHSFYPELEDHESVTDPRNRPPVPGMGGQNLWWFQHQWGDRQNVNLSFYNANEAAMIVGFVKHLIQNGMRPAQITILTYYKGQVSLVLEKLRKDPILDGYNPSKEWSVRTVDGFQGEENDIILLSLVRSPSSPHERARVGFVDDENRAVVATSRARCGLYVFGNSNNLLSCSKSNQTWQKVYDVFVKERCIGYQMSVICQNHENATILRHPDDWNKIPWGGCQQRCNETCPEGHPCNMTCHAGNVRFKCKEKCKKVLFCGHECMALCGDSCDCPDGCNKPTIANAQSLPLPLRLSTTSVSGIKGGQRRRHIKNHSSGPAKKGHDIGGKNGGTRSGDSIRTTALRNPLNRINPPLSFGSPFDTQVSAPSQGLSEPTSEDLIEEGYHALVTRDGGSAIRLPLSATTSAGFGIVDISEGESLSDKWSPEKIQAGDSALQLLQLNQGSPRPGPMKLRQTFWSTNPTNRQPEVIDHIIPAPQIKSNTLNVGRESSTFNTVDQRSRKQALLDAAAGFHIDDMGPMESKVLSGQACQMMNHCEMDLIEFD